MQSVKSKIIIWVVKHRHWFRGQLREPVIDASFDVTAFRKRTSETSLKMEKIPDDIKVEKVAIGDIYGEWLMPVGCEPQKVVMYIHGGGFIGGDCDSHRMHMVKFAKATRTKILQFNYRLAPEFPFPAAVEDCLTVYSWLLKQGYDPAHIVIGGESAGGTLTLSTLLMIKAKSLPYPARAFSISPVTDLSCQADAFERNWKKDIAPYDSWRVWTQMYIGDTDVSNPILSPQFGDLSGLPPLLIVVGSNEIHYDDCVAFSKKGLSQNVDVRLSVWEHMVHAFPIMAPLFKEATEAFDAIRDFILGA
ncbi:MAG: alpha/beta hydrolase [Clostridia bacterium]|nr:alpha/beta hydrolase [Clostridia bacterium]